MSIGIIKGIDSHIIEEYIPLVKYIASRVSLGRNKYMEYDDLVGYGMIGLIDAFKRYDGSKGMKFSSYASIRIKGEMIDQLRKARPISKKAMDKLKKYNEGIDFLRGKLLREPTDEELRLYLNFGIDEILEVEGYINKIAIVSLDDMIFSEEDEMSLLSTIEDRDSKSPEEEYISNEMIEILGETIDSLKEKDKLILSLYYYEELTLKEIGEILKVSESRVCQLHSRAIKTLRDKMHGKFKLKK